MAVIIKNLTLKGRYRIEWLRYITGVNLSQHCLKSLIGHSDKRIMSFKTKYENLELKDAKFYYFCAVEENFTWRLNIHIPFREKEGFLFKIDTDLVKGEFHNAEFIDIDPRQIDWSLPQSHQKAFSTCRNWQFANQIRNEFPTFISTDPFNNLNTLWENQD
jgi:hypothetical protein